MVAPTETLAVATTMVVDMVAAATNLKVRATVVRGSPHGHPCSTLGPDLYICGLVKARRLLILVSWPTARTATASAFACSVGHANTDAGATVAPGARVVASYGAPTDPAGPGPVPSMEFPASCNAFLCPDILRSAVPRQQFQHPIVDAPINW